MYIIRHDGQFKVCLSNFTQVILYNCKSKEKIKGVDELHHLLNCDYSHSIRDEIYDQDEIEIVFQIRHKYKAMKFQLTDYLGLTKAEMLRIWHRRYDVDVQPLEISRELYIRTELRDKYFPQSNVSNIYVFASEKLYDEFEDMLNYDWVKVSEFAEGMTVYSNKHVWGKI